jgi:folylpolyglutamate synthase/dihydropteroate synthase
MIDVVHLDVLVPLAGCAEGLPQKTARLQLRVIGDRVSWQRHSQPGTSVLAVVAPAPLVPCALPESDSFADWLVTLTLAIQREAGEAVWRGTVLTDHDEHLSLALPFVREPILKAAVHWALRFLIGWGHPATDDRQRDQVAAAYRSWLDRARAGGLPPFSQRLALAALGQGWPTSVDGQRLQIGWGARQRCFDGSLSEYSPLIAVATADDLMMSRQRLKEAGLPVPASALVQTLERALVIAKEWGWRAALSVSRRMGGVTLASGIEDESVLRTALAAANGCKLGGLVMEQRPQGTAYCLLVVRGRMLMAAECPSRVEPTTLEQLTPVRDVTNLTHRDNRQLAERAVRVIGLEVGSVALCFPDICQSWRVAGGTIRAVDPRPGLLPLWQNVPASTIDVALLHALFDGSPPRIPTAAITGTNGKTTTARMLNHIWQTMGKVTGLCTSEEVWIGHERVAPVGVGCSGARRFLNDPGVEVAVLEVTRKMILHRGHPCDRYQVAALLNVQDDHLGLDGIETLEAMAELKAEVLERAITAVVVNAEDPLSLNMRQRSSAPRQILVARNADSPALRAHLAAGGEAVFAQNHQQQPWMVVAQGSARTPVLRLDDIPATMNGLLRFNQDNSLFAAALAWAQDVPLPVIRKALSSFHNSPEQNPGRYNFIRGLPFQVLLDYGHNPVGVRELFALTARLSVAGRRILVSLIGCRSRHHLLLQIPWMLKTFDAIFLSQDEDYFRQSSWGFSQADPLGDLLATAQTLIEPRLHEGQRLVLGRDDSVTLRQGLDVCQPGDLLVVLAEANHALPLIDAYRREQGGRL